MKKRDRHSPTANKKREHQHTRPGELPNIAELSISEITDEGEIIAVPLKWNPRHKAPHIIVTEKRGGPLVSKGDRILARMQKVKPYFYKAQLISILAAETPQKVLGIFVPTSGGGGLIEPVSRKSKDSYIVAPENRNGAEARELVSAMTLAKQSSHGLAQVRIEERLGDLRSPRAASLIASHMHHLPMVFDSPTLAEAEAAPSPVMEAGREDLRSFPLVTIDGEDARDFDDAVFAEADMNPKNPGGFHLLVAIADVAYYVTEGSALDHTAFERGNSVYFPDRVIPMLPERLSNGLCSLKPDEDRYCLAVHLWIDANGATKDYRFVRGLMRSQARLTYNQVESAKANAKEILVASLFAAYRALARERDARGALALNLPEYKVYFDAQGNVSNIAPRAQLESHRLIESFMVAANVAAAHFLIKHKAPGIFRVHETPSPEKLDDLRQFLDMSGYSLAKGAITASHLNRVLEKSEGKPNAALIHTAVLRSQMQAYYSHENLGHFGLGLQHYGHFTSPIRRYSDLIVHRSLVALLDKHKKHLPPSGKLAAIAQHISETERRAMLAERDALDRYKVSYMAQHIGNVFSGTITGLNEFGLFVSLIDNGVTGFVPVRNLPGDFYMYNKRHGCFKGQRSGRLFTLGEPIMVRVFEANAITGSLIFKPEDGDTPEPSHKRNHHDRKPSKQRDKSSQHHRKKRR